MMKQIFTQLLLIGMIMSGTCLKAQDSSYVIKRGDVLDVRVMEHPEFSIQGIYVLPDGTLQYPGFGSIIVTGMSPKQLKDTIETALTKYVVNPIVTIFVRKLYQQSINILGYVNRPGQYQIFEEQDLFFALGLAGGVRELKKVKVVKIIRANGQIEEFDIKKFLRSSENYTETPVVRAGDAIYVKEPREINWGAVSAIISAAHVAVIIWRYGL